MKYIKLSIFFILIQTVLFGSSLQDYKYTAYNKGDNLNISSCDKHGWCKLKNTNFYVKEYNLNKPTKSNSKYIARHSGFKYEYKTTLKITPKLVAYLSKKASTSNERIKIDAKWGYSRAYFIKRYMQTLNANVIVPVKKKEELVVLKEIKKQNKHIEILKKEESKFNISVGFASSKLTIQTTLEENLQAENSIDDKATTYDLGLGYKFSNSILTSLNIANTSLEIADIQNTYFSLNYIFSNTLFKPYIGAIAGYSQLTWTKSPLVATIQSDLKYDSFMYGVQIGASKSITTNLSIFTQYQSLFYNYELDINNGASNIEHTSQTNMMIGIKYDL